MADTTQLKLHATGPTGRRTLLKEIALVFLRLGCTTFGGPAGHIAMMEDELVQRRNWLSREKFLDLLGAVNLLPGPNSTEMALYIGRLRAGMAGLFVAGICFILPSAILVTVITSAYVRYGTLPQVEGLLYGTKPVIIAVVLQALWGLGRAAVKTKFLAVTGAAAVAAGFLGSSVLSVLFASGAATGAFVALGRWRSHGNQPRTPLMGLFFGKSAWPSLAAGAAAIGLWPIFLYFVKVGAVLFGSGYLLLAFLRADLVERLHWLTEAQLLDAVAVGQVTPGPLSTAATFIGYVLAGPQGALVATIGIFLPGFVLAALSGRLVPRIRRSPVAGAFLDGVNVAALALMAVVSWQLARAALVDTTTVALAASAVLLLRYRVNSAWLVLGGALAGLVVSALGAR